MTLDLAGLAVRRDSRPIIVYIAGYGRSGSTLLDVLLGGHSEAFGAGELRWLFRDSISQKHCACGKAVAACEFWQQVLERVFDEISGIGPSEAALLTERVEALGMRNGDRTGYCRLWETTFRAIATISGKRFVVDSSKCDRKVAHRLPLFAQHFAVPVKAVHLVRDPRAVMYSIRRGSNRRLNSGENPHLTGGAMRGLLGWVFSNSLTEMVRRRNPALPFLRIRYEDIVTAPRQSFDRLGDFLGTSLQELADRIEHQEPFAPGHGIAGNRMRGAGPIQLRYDRRWETELPRYARILAQASRPLMNRYGYGAGQELADSRLIE